MFYCSEHLISEKLTTRSSKEVDKTES